MVTAAVVETQTSTKLKNTLKVDFKFDSMTLVLYSPNGTEVTTASLHTFTNTIIDHRKLHPLRYSYQKVCVSAYVSVSRCRCWTPGMIS